LSGYHPQVLGRNPKETRPQRDPGVTVDNEVLKVLLSEIGWYHPRSRVPMTGSFLFGENMEIEPRPQYEIRTTTVDDIKVLRAMHGQSWRDTYRNDEIGVTEQWLEEETRNWLTPEMMQKTYDRLSPVFPDPTQLHRIAFKNGAPVGFIHLSTREDGGKLLEGFYVAKDAQGTGLAQQLMEQAAEFIGEHEVELEVVSYNDRAKAFYRKYGFKETDKENELFKEKMPVTTMIRPAGYTTTQQGDAQ
jgi:ribosomal protein S18 acetylase RimI-like enzyme